ncbi:MAG TPA: acyl-CoA dehydrogenase family protein [Dehalococcoidia bacterium]|nr:acyl-CoA dehydrogenase family protein [Dehalococcoidia bacterium]
MDFHLTPEEEAFRQEVHDFIEKECPPSLRGGGGSFFENAGDYVTWRKKLAGKGWIAPAWPKEYGGAQMTVMEQFVYNMETARMRAPSPIFIGGLGVAVLGPTILVYGDDEQKQEYIPGILSGEDMWCQGFSEPESGSDLASLKTRAVRDGDDYVINGQKIWTTLAHMSKYMLCLCRTDPDAPKHKGISYFVIPMDAPGVTVRPLINMAGGHEFNEVFFEDVRIPAKNLLGEENRGWYMAVTTLDIERSNIGSAVGQNQSVEDLINFTREHKDNGQAAASHNPKIRLELAERLIETEASMMLSHRLITMQNRGLIPNYEASATKLYSMELNQRIANTGIKVLGMYGQLGKGSPYEAMKGRLMYQYLRSVANTIEGGTTEIQKNIVATRGLGLPRE